MLQTCYINLSQRSCDWYLAKKFAGLLFFDKSWLFLLHTAHFKDYIILEFLVLFGPYTLYFSHFKQNDKTFWFSDLLQSFSRFLWSTDNQVNSRFGSGLFEMWQFFGCFYMLSCYYLLADRKIWLIILRL